MVFDNRRKYLCSRPNTQKPKVKITTFGVTRKEIEMEFNEEDEKIIQELIKKYES